MISSIVRLLIYLLLVNIIFGFYVPSDDSRRLNQLLKQRSAEHDNEYVWFTRDIHDYMNSDEIKQDQRWKQQDLFHSRFSFNKIFNQKYPFVENTMYQTK